MYKIIKAVGKYGVDKISKIEATHSLEGTFYVSPFVGGCVYFVYNDNTRQMMISSSIEEVEYVNSTYKIKTRNSEYWFEEVKDDAE
jgi:hypothetical protein